LEKQLKQSLKKLDFKTNTTKSSSKTLLGGSNAINVENEFDYRSLFQGRTEESLMMEICALREMVMGFRDYTVDAIKLRLYTLDPISPQSEKILTPNNQQQIDNHQSQSTSLQHQQNTESSISLPSTENNNKSDNNNNNNNIVPISPTSDIKPDQEQDNSETDIPLTTESDPIRIEKDQIDDDLFESSESKPTRDKSILGEESIQTNTSKVPITSTSPSRSLIGGDNPIDQSVSSSSKVLSNVVDELSRKMISICERISPDWLELGKITFCLFFLFSLPSY
jgi:hypothetical protein